MKIEEMIKVMQHFADGGEVEFSNDEFKSVLGEANKENDKGLNWNWDELDYRIKEQKQKVTIEKWLCKDIENDFIIIESSNINNCDCCEKIKLLETYEVEI